MRISVREDDPGYNPEYMFYEVLLDGVSLKDCVTADEELGLALCYKKGPDDKYIIDHADDTMVTEERHGKVEIKNHTPLPIGEK